MTLHEPVMLSMYLKQIVELQRQASWAYSEMRSMMDAGTTAARDTAIILQEISARSYAMVHEYTMAKDRPS
jgi:hypothetical protein